MEAQLLMRSLKTTGGMTHGSGMTDNQRALWTMSKGITLEYKTAMQEFTNIHDIRTAQGFD